ACQAPISAARSKRSHEYGIAWAVPTTAFPITPFGAPCRTGRTRVRRLPCAGTLRRDFRSGRGTSLRPVDLLARHQRPGDARHLVRERHGGQPDRPPLQEPAGPRPGGTAPVLGPVDHRRGPEDQQPADLPVAGLGDPAEAGPPAAGPPARERAAL